MKIVQIENGYINNKKAIKTTPDIDDLKGFHHIFLEKTPAGNSGFAKKRVQWLIEHSTSYQHLWFIDSLELRNPLLRKAAKRWLTSTPSVFTLNFLS